MGDDLEVHAPEGDPGGHAVDAVIDQAKSIGEHGARLDIHDAALGALGSAVEDVKSSLGYVNTRLDNLDRAPLQPVVDAGDVAKEVVHELAKGADAVADTAEPIAVAAPEAVDNEAKEESGGFMKMVRGLNLH
jgi:hypothetical protein